VQPVARLPADAAVRDGREEATVIDGVGHGRHPAAYWSRAAGVVVMEPPRRRRTSSLAPGRSHVTLDAGTRGTRTRDEVVVAHPDDDTFACGSLLLAAAASGALTAVTCATRGEAGGSADDLGVVRERELRAAAAALSVEHVEVLDFADSGMSGDTGVRPSSVPPSTTWSPPSAPLSRPSGRTSWSPSTPATVTATTCASGTPPSPPGRLRACRGSTCRACHGR